MDFKISIKHVLADIGLTELQIKCYLVLLQSRGMKISTLAKELGVNRPNTYTLFEKLKELGLVYEENKVTGKIVYAHSYKEILKLLSDKIEKISENRESIEKIIPQFKDLEEGRMSFIPKIRAYETKQGLNAIVDEMFHKRNNGKEILLWTNQETEQSIFSHTIHEEFVRRRMENGMFVRVLTVTNRKGQNLKSKDKNLFRETRLLPKSFNFEAEIYLYDSKVVMLDVKEDVVGVVIESEELYSIQKQVLKISGNQYKVL